MIYVCGFQCRGQSRDTAYLFLSVNYGERREIGSTNYTAIIWTFIFTDGYQTEGGNNSHNDVFHN